MTRGDNRRSNGFRVSKERKGSKQGGQWREIGPVNGQSLPADGNEALESAVEKRRKECDKKIDLNIGRKKVDAEYRLKNEEMEA